MAERIRVTRYDYRGSSYTDFPDQIPAQYAFEVNPKLSQEAGQKQLEASKALELKNQGNPDVG